MIAWIKFSESAIQPKKGTPGSAGYDLYSAEDITIPSKQRACVATDVGVLIPSGYYGRVAPRSSLAYRYGIDVFAGVIDNDYRDKIGVILYNSGDDQFNINKGDRIAQIIFEKCLHSDNSGDFIDLKDAEKFSCWKTERDGGFGSTGV